MHMEKLSIVAAFLCFLFSGQEIYGEMFNSRLISANQSLFINSFVFVYSIIFLTYYAFLKFNSVFTKNK